MGQMFPSWIRRKWGSGTDFAATKELVEDLGLHTVCQSARCPNIGECWRERTATFMILGKVCTRNCGFCSVRHGKGELVDPEEPERLAEAIERLGVRHAVITSVTRDDLEDGGACQYAACIAAVRQRCPEATIEVLTPDFRGSAIGVAVVQEARPDVFGHNVETVERLFPELRGMRASYARSLDVLRAASAWSPPTIIKSALMLGHGETESEIREAFEDLLEAGCQAVSLGQYLRPSRQQREVVEFVSPERFDAYRALALEMGFAYAVAGPFVRSSYRSGGLVQALTKPEGDMAGIAAR